jgi:flagellar biosynthesis regulator FlbT
MLDDSDVLQPESTTTPALLYFTNILDSWPNSIALINAGSAINYDTSIDKCYRSTPELLEDIPNLPII